MFLFNKKITYTEFIMNLIINNQIETDELYESYVDLSNENDPIFIINEKFKNYYYSKKNNWSNDKSNYFNNVSTEIINFLILLTKNNDIKWTQFIYNEIILLVEDYIDKNFPNNDPNEFNKLKISIERMCKIYPNNPTIKLIKNMSFS